MGDAFHITLFAVFACGALYCAYRWLIRRTLWWATWFLLASAWASANALQLLASHPHHRQTFAVVQAVAVAGVALLGAHSLRRRFSPARAPQPDDQESSR